MIRLAPPKVARTHAVKRTSAIRDEYRCRACDWTGTLATGIRHAVLNQFDERRVAA